LQNIDDLASFVNAYKKLETDNAALLVQSNETRHLRAQLSESKLQEQKAAHIAKRAQAESSENTARVASVQKELQESREKEEKACKKIVSMQYNLGLQEVKSRSADISRQAAEREVRNRDIEISELALAKEVLEQRLRDTEFQQQFKQRIQDLEAENESLKGQVDDLEKEIKDTRDKFAEYQRKIRAVSLHL
jgi:chromosome segregation ATPase